MHFNTCDLRRQPIAKCSRKATSFVLKSFTVSEALNIRDCRIWPAFGSLVELWNTGGSKIKESTHLRSRYDNGFKFLAAGFCGDVLWCPIRPLICDGRATLAPTTRDRQTANFTPNGPATGLAPICNLAVDSFAKFYSRPNYNGYCRVSCWMKDIRRYICKVVTANLCINRIV